MQYLLHYAGRVHERIKTYPLHTLVGGEQLQSKGPARRHSHLVTSSCCVFMHACSKLDIENSAVTGSLNCTSKVYMHPHTYTHTYITYIERESCTHTYNTVQLLVQLLTAPVHMECRVSKHCL